jgi:Pyruvate/2-oxoglutarate dehydrogenase complex, dihydrolipoamide acyltransferase (E2) component, and related enzymes
MKFRTLMLLATTLLSAPAIAQEAPAPAASIPRQDEIKAQSPLAAREQALAPVLSWMQSLGIKLTYLGDEGGLSGYLAEDATGKMQTIYVTPDRQHVVAGLLLKRGGDNITGVQVGEMRERFARAAEQYVPKDDTAEVPLDVAPATSTTEAEVAPEKASSASEGAVEVPSTAPVTPEPKVDVPDEKAEAPVSSDTPAPVALALPEASGPVEGAAGNPAELWVSKIDQDKFLKAAAEVPYFEVGSRSAPITLYEIADPQCPYCHAAWNEIKQLVFDKKVKLRVILIAALNGSEPKVRDILASGVPARRWIDSDAGKNLKLEVDPESQPYKDSADFLDKNMGFAREFGVDRTPFLGYVGFDGKFYSALGLPSDLGAFLSAAVAR